MPALYPPAPRVELPGRDYVHFRGPLVAMTELARYDGAEVLDAVAQPVLARRPGLVRTEIDFDSTLVAGTAETIAAVLATCDLQAHPIGPEDAPQSHADHVNG